jgi:hypothetical protein
MGCDRDRIRTWVGEAGGFTGRTTVFPLVPSYPRLAPLIAGDVHERPVDSFRCRLASPPVPLRPVRPGVGRRESGGKSWPPSNRHSGPNKAAPASCNGCPATYELTGPEAITFHDVASQVPGVTGPAGSVRAGP